VGNGKEAKIHGKEKKESRQRQERQVGLEDLTIGEKKTGKVRE